MSVNYILERDKCYLYKDSKVNDWGLTETTEDKTELWGMVRYIDELLPIPLADNKSAVPTIRVSFNGAVNIKAGDCLEIEGERFTALRVKSIKDLAGNVIMTKVNL